MAVDPAKYLRIFRQESDEHLRALADGLIQLEQASGDKELIHSLLRSAHTLKGAARMMNFPDICEVAHKMEDLFGAVEKGQCPVSAPVIDVLLEGTDAIKALIEAMALPAGTPKPEYQAVVARLVETFDTGGHAPPRARTGPATPPAAPVSEASPIPETPSATAAAVASPPPAQQPSAPTSQPPAASHPPAAPLAAVAPPAPPVQAASPPPPPATPSEHLPQEKPSSADETIRVEISKVDQLLDMIGELLISKIKMEDKLARSRELYELCDALELEEGRRIRDRISKFTEDLTADMVEMNYLTQEIQNRAMKIRMLPADTIFDSFHRTVRDLSRELGKDVQLKLTGRKTELDKRVLEEIKPSLIHIIRNSMDHGIELPDAREARGKPRQGTIHLSAGHKGNTVTIGIEDDGGGIDPEKVKRKALERGLIDAKRAASMSDREAVYLIMAPGFSTAEIITDISGRGVGMDVVKTNVQHLKGDVTIESEVGCYTRITITLPMTLSTMNVLLVECAGDIYAFPLNFLEETCIVEGGDLITEGGRSVMALRGHTVAVSRLDTLLGFAPKPGPPPRELQVVLVHSRGTVVGFIVDRFVGNQEIVVKTLGDHLRFVGNVAGATILGSGEPALILNPVDLVALAAGEREQGLSQDRKHDEQPRSILVVDDSITTRTMEKNVLETAGYDIEVAVNGHDALEKLALRHYNLVVSDIEMPGMNGFELIEKMKKDERLRELPVIIVSALATDEDKRRGIAVGANAYITKGTFDQENLLNTVRRLIR